MKKTGFLLAAIVTIGIMSVPVSAHGCRGRGNGGQSTTSYTVCAVEGCAQSGLHEHDGAYYYCASHGAGGCYTGGHCYTA